MSRVTEQRQKALIVLASYWGFSEPVCMWPGGCSCKTDFKGNPVKLEINHIYAFCGEGNAERKAGISPPKLYWMIVDGRYDKSKLNILCWVHNRPGTWAMVSGLLICYELKYSPKWTYEDLLNEAKMVARTSDDTTFTEDIKRRLDAYVPP